MTEPSLPPSSLERSLLTAQAHSVHCRWIAQCTGAGAQVQEVDAHCTGEIDYLFPGEGAHCTILKRPRHTSLKAEDQPTKEMKLLKMDIFVGNYWLRLTT